MKRIATVEHLATVRADDGRGPATSRAYVPCVAGTLIKREVLYDEVWAEPMTKVAARYGTTGPKLAKVCDQLDVPRPSSGYWVQLAHGTAPERPPLPPLRAGAPAQWELVPTPPVASHPVSPAGSHGSS